MPSSTCLSISQRPISRARLRTFATHGRCLRVPEASHVPAFRHVDAFRDCGRRLAPLPAAVRSAVGPLAAIGVSRRRGRLRAGPLAGPWKGPCGRTSLYGLSNSDVPHLQRRQVAPKWVASLATALPVLRRAAFLGGAAIAVRCAVLAHPRCGEGDANQGEPSGGQCRPVGTGGGRGRRQRKAPPQGPGPRGNRQAQAAAGTADDLLGDLAERVTTSFGQLRDPNRAAVDRASETARSVGSTVVRS
jgi:hypothetical protein